MVAIAAQGLLRRGLTCVIGAGTIIFMLHLARDFFGWEILEADLVPKKDALPKMSAEPPRMPRAQSASVQPGVATEWLEYPVPPWGPTPIASLRQREPNGQCSSTSATPSTPAAIYDLTRAPQLNHSQFNETLTVEFDVKTWEYGEGVGSVKARLKKRNFFGRHCPARCTLVEKGGEAYVFNMFTTDFKKKVKNGTISVVSSGEILGKMWAAHVKKGVGLRMSTSMLANETDIAIPFGCGFSQSCRDKACPPDFVRKGKRPLLPGGDKITANVISIIQSAVKPRSEVLKNLMRQLASNGVPGVNNFGPLFNNRASGALSGRGGYADGSKVKIFSAYPFAFVPENSWSIVPGSGYVTEKAYDAYMAGTLPIWEGTLNSQHLHLYFPTALKRNQTLLRVKDYPTWKNASGLAQHIQYLVANPEAYQEYFEWDPEWFRTGPLRRACEEKSRWCKMCVALHTMRQGYCPPFI